MSKTKPEAHSGRHEKTGRFLAKNRVARRRPGRTPAEIDRDPTQESRGKWGRRAGAPDPRGHEERLGLICDLLAHFVMVERTTAALNPASEADSEPTVAEQEIGRTIAQLASVGDLRCHSAADLHAQRTQIESTSIGVFDRIFKALGEDARLWWLNRKGNSSIRYHYGLIGQKLLGTFRGGLADVAPGTLLTPGRWSRLARKTKVIPSGKPIREKMARELAAEGLGLRRAEDTLRKLPADPIAFRHAAQLTKKAKPAKK